MVQLLIVVILYAASTGSLKTQGSSNVRTTPLVTQLLPCLPWCDDASASDNAASLVKPRFPFLSRPVVQAVRPDVKSVIKSQITQ